jgi:hypothetical protein
MSAPLSRDVSTYETSTLPSPTNDLETIPVITMVPSQVSTHALQPIQWVSNPTPTLKHANNHLPQHPRVNSFQHGTFTHPHHHLIGIGNLPQMDLKSNSRNHHLAAEVGQVLKRL